eukprot:TRINITY_DN9661_c0_g1_i1.p1 TRINITY_DN9661_c0_g1~~TRINITY_DN9661_c0_g1_i1.p1  ORF type:complete len:574 (+),score=103.83 TRINITY_DN9661_c0_g1_i1:41-1723(+)
MDARAELMTAPASLAHLAVDDLGNPFLVFEEQAKEKRLSGIDALKANILAAITVADTLRTSLGPNGMDKMLVGSDGEVTVTNDGATILEHMDVGHPIAKLLADLSKAQDAEIGDGTTAVVILAGALLRQAGDLVDRGIHPLCISNGFEKACEVAAKRVKEIAREVSVFTGDQHPSAGDQSPLRKAAMTSLVSKVVGSQKEHLAKLCVEAVLSVADFEHSGDVQFDHIKVEGKPGGKLEDTSLIQGVVLDRGFSHPQMPKNVRDARIAILSCPFEPPKPKTKHKLDIVSSESYRRLHEVEQSYFQDQIKRLKAAGANLVICQWGFDDEANHLLYTSGIPAVRWVGGVDLELVAIATGGHIVARFEELTPEKLGRAEVVFESSFGTDTKDSFLIIREHGASRAVTLLVRGGNIIGVEEAKRSLHDAICCVRNLVRHPWVVPGGGASEIAAALAVRAFAEKESSVEQYSIRAFATALEDIPAALAANGGLCAIGEVARVTAKQENTGDPCHGIDCMQLGTTDMWVQNVYEACASKCSQLQLATQVVKLILKIDDVLTVTDIIE